jgi:DNA-binding transcriptional MerR regulator
MEGLATDAVWLKGKRVAITGRLAALTRAEAAALLEAYGGIHVQAVTSHTDFLIVGQEGLPLTRSGALTPKLQRAKMLQGRGSLTILSEEEFLDRLDVAGSSGPVQRRYTTAQLCRLLRIPRDRLRTWVRQGLIEPIETVHGLYFFDFQQVTSAKALWDLTKTGVTGSRIQKSLEQLRNWLAVDKPLAQLALIERDGRLLLRLEEGQLAEPSGQLQFDFTSDSPAVVIDADPNPCSAERWWERGCDFEEAGKLPEAAAAYREALRSGGPNPLCCFNLGNILYALDQKGQAAERFRQAVELDPCHVEAWNNLGVTLADVGQINEAVTAFDVALKVNPQYAEAHYNLADTLEDAGRHAQAKGHWQAYLCLEPSGLWAKYARGRLAQ